jgi:hypothetical protein
VLCNIVRVLAPALTVPHVLPAATAITCTGALQVIRTLNAQRAPEAPELPVTALEQKNVRKGSDKDPYSAAHAQCFDSVSRWYACDIEHYGFAGAKHR